ncbi:MULTISPECIES: hypothetical protein [unclassified Mesorhizobium]|uniref:hypothetical protein n=1 Tax=unclassified Mesorhizobium TaxID=325217 RepID=UPI000FD406FE|nr:MULTISPECIES: hypothetical protein [unclassified Mesorhizobium]RUU95217.1 hypothetical protein EOA79_28995 [Mesorhizobium sp. M1A.F.Ca.IN.020.03.2.1]RWG87154.1 MAG: hypothetical protein EOQ70_14130 [Mesorhizobium sp.]RWK18208.1 MAG: hypothetical protein EOR41_13605 [Mesorhizobium sp.]
MSRERLSIDLDEFKPEPKKVDPHTKAAVEQEAENNGFKTRHAAEPARKAPAPKPAPDVVPAQTEREGEPRRRGRKHTTNRNTPFAVKLKAETNNMICDYADRLECTAIADVIELALGALQKELDEGIDPRARAAVKE